VARAEISLAFRASNAIFRSADAIFFGREHQCFGGAEVQRWRLAGRFLDGQVF
jgi:hypothetical protein